MSSFDAETAPSAVPATLCGAGLVVCNVLPSFLAASLIGRIGQDFRFGPEELGLALALFSVFCAAGSTAAGRVVSLVGPTVAARASASVTAATSLAIALAVDSTAGLVALLVLSGAGNSLGVPAASALFRTRVPVSRRNSAFAALQAGAPVGSLLAGLALPAVAVPLGWRAAYVMSGCVAIAIAVCVPRVPHRRKAAAAANTGSRHRRQIFVLAGAAALASAAAMGVAAFVVSYALAEGMTETTAGALLAALSVAAATSRIALGMAADARPIEPLWISGAMLAASAGGYLLLTSGTPAVIFAGVLVVGLFGWSWPGVLTLAVVDRSPDAPAWAAGIMMSGLFVGGAAGPLAVGLLSSSGGFEPAWVACALSALAASALVLVVRETKAAPAT